MEYANIESFINPQPVNIKYVFDLDFTLYNRDDFREHPNLNFMYNSFQKKPFLHQLLKSLPGDKFLFTNGNYKHAQEVLRRCDIPESIFQKVVSYDMMGALKPSPISFNYAINQFGIDNKDIVIFFEDTLENLRVAKESHGWLTVWIHPQSRQPKPDYVDYSFPNIEEALLFFVIREKVNKDILV